MANSTLIVDYLGEGLAANRPATPPVAAGVLALYYATDTNVLSGWDGSAWQTVNAEGTLTKIVAGAGLSGGTITSDGTIALGTIAAGLLMGNAGTAGAVPDGITVGSGLSLDAAGTISATGTATVSEVVAGSGLSGGTITGAGTIALGTIAATSLMGNGATTVAVPGAIAMGTGVALNAGTLTASGSGGTLTTIVAGAGLNGGTITLDGTLALDGAATATAGQVLQSGGSSAVAWVSAIPAASSALLGGSGTTGTAASVAIGADLALSGGTLDLGTIAPAGELLGNPGTAAAKPSGIAVGANLTLDALGTLSATGGGAGEWSAGTVTTIGSGLTLNAGTISAADVPSGPTLNVPSTASTQLNTSAQNIRGNEFTNTFASAITITNAVASLQPSTAMTITAGAALMTSGSIISGLVTSSSTVVGSGSQLVNLPLSGSLVVAQSEVFATFMTTNVDATDINMPNYNPQSQWGTSEWWDASSALTPSGVLVGTLVSQFANGQTLTYIATGYTGLLTFEYEK